MAYVNSPIEVTQYNTLAFDFVGAVADILNVRDLSRLHEWLGSPALFDRQHDQSTEAHRRFYGHENNSPVQPTHFKRLYRNFIREVVEPFVGEPAVFQALPTFRVHLPGNVAVGEFHKDSDYGHSSAEINFWVPLTVAEGSSLVQFGDATFSVNNFGPLKMGDILVFDGADLLHGNVPNTTGRTRVSFDFRAIRRSKFVPHPDRLTINTGLPFDLGGYYDVLKPS